MYVHSLSRLIKTQHIEFYLLGKSVIRHISMIDSKFIPQY